MRQAFTLLAALTVAVFLTTAMAADNDALDLRLRLQPGDTYKATATIERTYADWIEDVETTEVTVVELTLTMTTLDVDEEGNATIEITYDRYAVSSNGDKAERFEFDSDSPPDELNGPVAVTAALVGQSYKARLSPRGEVLTIEEADELRQALADATRQAGRLMPRASAEVLTLLDDEGLEEHLPYCLTVYPDKPATSGDTWIRQVKQSVLLATPDSATAHKEFQVNVPALSIPVIADAAYTLESRHNGIATINVKETFTLDKDKLRPSFARGNENAENAGEGEATIVIDEETGVPVEADLRRVIDGQRKTVLVGHDGRLELAPTPTTFETTISVRCERVATE
ncbi:MAG: hypothetical protein JW889_07905 [Verrucomicrobia bacterium]|nr:hypothetical protein [Verrucomicrobiota bacterium]